jgi:hypothetical protein
VEPALVRIVKRAARNAECRRLVSRGTGHRSLYVADNVSGPMNLRLAVALSLAFVACKKEQPPSEAPKQQAAEKAAPAAPAAANGEVKFTLGAPKVGAKFASMMETALEMKMGPSSMSSKEKGRYEVEVLEVDEDAPTKAKVKYTDKSTKDLEDGKEKPSEKSPVLGKTYVVSLDGENVVIKDEKGQLASEEEAAIVRDDVDFLGKPDEFRSTLAKRTYKVGEKAPELIAAVQHLVADDASSGSGDAPNISDVTLELKEDQGAIALFAVGMKMAMADPDMPMNVKLSGNLEVRKADAQLMKLQLAGPIELTSAELKALASGKMSMTMTQQDL